MTSIDEAMAIIADIGSDALCTMLDCYAVASNGEDIETLLRRWVPGEGITDFGAVLDMLIRLDYSGISAVEPVIYEPDGLSCAARSIGYLRGLMKGAAGRQS